MSFSLIASVLGIKNTIGLSYACSSFSVSVENSVTVTHGLRIRPSVLILEPTRAPSAASRILLSSLPLARTRPYFGTSVQSILRELPKPLSILYCSLNLVKAFSVSKFFEHVGPNCNDFAKCPEIPRT